MDYGVSIISQDIFLKILYEHAYLYSQFYIISNAEWFSDLPRNLIKFW